MEFTILEAPQHPANLSFGIGVDNVRLCTTQTWRAGGPGLLVPPCFQLDGVGALLQLLIRVDVWALLPRDALTTTQAPSQTQLDTTAAAGAPSLVGQVSTASSAATHGCLSILTFQPSLCHRGVRKLCLLNTKCSERPYNAGSISTVKQFGHKFGRGDTIGACSCLTPHLTCKANVFLPSVQQHSHPHTSHAGVLYNPAFGTVSYTRNGQHIGTAASNLPPGMQCLLIGFGQPEIKVRAEREYKTPTPCQCLPISFHAMQA